VNSFFLAGAPLPAVFEIDEAGGEVYLDTSEISIVSVEESIGRVVGKRRPGHGNFEDRFKLQDTGLAMQRALKHRWRVHGVFKFKTHEEADERMMKLVARVAQRMPNSDNWGFFCGSYLPRMARRHPKFELWS
jgi:hypothetical protein